jgi:hypothetical protein
LDVPARNRFFDDEGFEFLTLIALGSTAYRMAEVGEVLATVAGVESGDSQLRTHRLLDWLDETLGR